MIYLFNDRVRINGYNESAMSIRAHQWFGHLMVEAKSSSDGGRRIVVALFERQAVMVATAASTWPVVSDMVNVSMRTDPAAGESSNRRLISQLEENNDVRFREAIEGLCLGKIARVPINDPTPPGIRTFKALLNHLTHQSIRYHLAAIDDAFDLTTKVRFRCDFITQQISSGYVRDMKMTGQEAGLGAFPSPLRSKNDKARIHHVQLLYTMSWFTARTIKILRNRGRSAGLGSV